jgi:hypothetical protein
VQFEWDPQKAAANVKRRRITFDEAASVLGDPLSTTYPDEAHSDEETRFLTIGASHRGRVMVVAHTERNRYNPHHKRPTSNEARTRIL